MANADARGYISNRFALEFDDKKPAGFVSAIDGAHFKSTPVKTMVGNSNNVSIYGGKPTYDEFTITVGMAMSAGFWSWVKASIDNKPERRNGALVGYDFDNCERSRRTFHGALISAVKFPKLDPSASTPGTIDVTISPEKLEHKEGDKSKLAANAGQAQSPKQKRWQTANFRLELDRFKGDESLKTVSVEGFTVKQNIIPQNIGYELESRKAIGRLELPQIQVSIHENRASEWFKWYDLAVVKGNRRGQTTTGVLTYYATDKSELMRIEFAGVSLANLDVEKYEAKQTGIANITATLNVEEMKLVAGAGNV
jgi:hypothetical protein